MCKMKEIENWKGLEVVKKSLIPCFSEEWEKVDASEKGNMSPFYFSEDKTEAVIDNRELYATLKKYMTQVDIIPGKTYQICVPFQEFDTRGQNVVYGIISLKNSQGNITRRMYLERKVPEQLSYVFQAVEEVAVRLELGIKREGKVIWYRPLLQEVEAVKPRKVRLASVYLEYKEKGFLYEENLKRIEQSFDRAAEKGVDLIAFAEDINTSRTDKAQLFETLDGTFCKLMQRKAKEHSCYVFFSFHELDENGSKKNTAVLLDRNGELVGTYSKSHLTISEYEDGLVPGDSYSVFDTEFGKVGMLICWDAYFPETARAMTLKGAELLLVSTAGNPHHRHVSIAKENGVHVLVSCRSHKKEVGIEIAPTKIISPYGEILAQCNTEGDAAKAEIDLNESKEIYWLSVGPYYAYANNIYMQDLRDDLLDTIQPVFNIAKKRIGTRDL